MRLKDLILTVAKSLGGFALVRDSRWRRHRLMILCYHGIALDDEHEWDGAFYITQQRLRERLRALRDGGYTVLPLAEATRRLYDGTLPPRSVALTFDDGAMDFESRALPVLREFNAHATLYLSTYYCFVRLPVFDAILSYVIWKGRNSGVDLNSVLEATDAVPVATEAEQTRARALAHALVARNQMNAAEKDELVARIAEALGLDYPALKARGFVSYMSPDVVRNLPRDLVDVQLHTHRHRTPRDETLFKREVKDNIAGIAELRGPESLVHFCYPSGDYHGEFLPWLRDCGVEYATTCIPEMASRADDPLLLPRLVDTMEQSALSFESWISGFAMLLPRRREYYLDTMRLR